MPNLNKDKRKKEATHSAPAIQIFPTKPVYYRTYVSSFVQRCQSYRCFPPIGSQGVLNISITLQCLYGQHSYWVRITEWLSGFHIFSHKPCCCSQYFAYFIMGPKLSGAFLCPVAYIYISWTSSQPSLRCTELRKLSIP